MSIKLSECNFEYLRPPKEVFNVTHSESYIRHGEGKKSVRKIFRDVNFYPDELAKLKEFEALIEKEQVHLPPDWTMVDTMHYMYAGKWDIKKALKMLRHHLEWRASPERGVLTPGGLKLMQDGIVYIAGRDKQYRPIIVANVYRVDLKKVDIKDVISALCFVMDVVRKYYFVPGKVENWIFIIETNGAGIFNFPVKIVKTINDVSAGNYTSTLEKLIIMNPSSFLKSSWGLVSGFIDPETARKISMMKKSELGELNKTIDPNQLEAIYGGTLPTQPVYWPPVNTLGQPPYTEGVKLDIEIATSKALGIFPDLAEIIGTKEEMMTRQTNTQIKPESPEKQKNNEGEEISPVRGAARMSVPNVGEINFKDGKEIDHQQTVVLNKKVETVVANPSPKKDKEIGGENLHHVRGINEILADQKLMSEVKEVKERKISAQINNEEEETFKGHANINGASGVTVRKGNDTNDVSNNSGFGKLLKGGNEGEIILEGNSQKTKFCGFCRPNGSPTHPKEENGCNLF